MNPHTLVMAQNQRVQQQQAALDRANSDIAMLNERLAERTSGLLARHANDIQRRQLAEVQLIEAWRIINLLHSEYMTDPDKAVYPKALEWLERNEKYKPCAPP